MVVVRCLILCSKFAKNRLSAGLCPNSLGEITALPDPLAISWEKVVERGDGMAGRGGKGKERAGRRGGEEKGSERGAVSPSV